MMGCVQTGDALIVQHCLGLPTSRCAHLLARSDEAWVDDASWH
jgi:hypothetical protein